MLQHSESWQTWRSKQGRIQGFGSFLGVRICFFFLGSVPMIFMRFLSFSVGVSQNLGATFFFGNEWTWVPLRNHILRHTKPSLLCAQEKMVNGGISTMPAFVQAVDKLALRLRQDSVESVRWNGRDLISISTPQEPHRMSNKHVWIYIILFSSYKSFSFMLPSWEGDWNKESTRIWEDES